MQRLYVLYQDLDTGEILLIPESALINGVALGYYVSYHRGSKGQMEKKREEIYRQRRKVWRKWL